MVRRVEGGLGVDEVVVLGLQVLHPLLHLLKTSKLGKLIEDQESSPHLNINLPLKSDGQHAKTGQKGKAT